MGYIRKEEILKSVKRLGIDRKFVTVIENSSLRDGFESIWPAEIISDIVLRTYLVLFPDTIITFDKYGVSGHPNHIATHKGVFDAVKSIHKKNTSDVKLYELNSTNIIRKFIGVFDIFLSFILLSIRDSCCHFNRSNDVIVVCNFNAAETYLAMSEHASQFVWYRKLFVIFSSYTYVNTFRRRL